MLKRVKWTRAIGTMVKLNTDASWVEVVDYWAVVIRGIERQLLAVTKGRSQYTKIDMIELYDIMFVTELVRNYGHNEIEASTDSICMEFYLDMKETPSEVRKMVGRIKREIEALRD